MTALTESTRRKLSLLELAEELGNVSQACRIMGYHRDTFYEIRRAVQVGGVTALVEKQRGPKAPLLDGSAQGACPATVIADALPGNRVRRVSRGSHGKSRRTHRGGAQQ
jgi:hypothetical protein